MVQRIALELALSGDYYAGTAIQPPAIPTLHRDLANALDQLSPGAGASLQCCSRLDAGVAAHSFPVHAEVADHWHPLALAKALNGILLRSPAKRHAVIQRAAAVSAQWDAWRSARYKTYCYRVVVRSAAPLANERVHWLRRQPHIPSLHCAAEQLLGTHDLSGFACLRGDASDDYHPQRCIRQSQWSVAPEAWGWSLTYRVSGEGFLYRQVRGMVGAMLQVCLAQPPQPMAITTVIKHGRRAARLGEIAPACGLSLLAVDYGSDCPQWQQAQPEPHPEEQ